MKWIKSFDGVVTCPGCGWSGAAEKLCISEYYDSGISEYVCPICSEDVAFHGGISRDEFIKQARELFPDKGPDWLQ